MPYYEYLDSTKAVARICVECKLKIWADENDGGWDEHPAPPSWRQLEDAADRKLRYHIRIVHRKE